MARAIRIYAILSYIEIEGIYLQSIEKKGNTIINREVRITTSKGDDSLISEKEGNFVDGRIISIFNGHKLLGIEYETQIALIDIGRELSIDTTIDHPVRYLIVRQTSKNAPLGELLNGYWIEVYLFSVNPSYLDKLTLPIDLDDKNFFRNLGEEMIYLRPIKRDPYIDRWGSNKLLSIFQTESQKYGNKYTSAFDVTVETFDGIKLRGYTRENDLMRYDSGSIVNLNFHLVNCSHIFREREGVESFFRKSSQSGIYTYEIIGSIEALWWPETNVPSQRDDVSGRFFTVAVNNDILIRLEDSLDKRKDIGGLKLHDKIHAIGQLEFTQRLEDRFI